MDGLPKLHLIKFLLEKPKEKREERNTKKYFVMKKKSKK
jgi:hypothetical protein